MKAPTAPGKVLFISHDASRTGAPIVLLHLLRWLKANSDIAFHILLRNGGVLESDFSGLGEVSNLKKGFGASLEWIFKATRRPNLRKTAAEICLGPVKRRLKGENFRLIYANTVVNGDVLESLSGLGCPVVCHVHELEYWIRYCTDSGEFNKVKEYTDHYIAASEAVKRNLVANHAISEDRIDTVHEFIPVSAAKKTDAKEDRRLFLERMGIPNDSMIVGGSGTFEWRKGPDLFIHLARSVYARKPSVPVHFIWVGGESEGPRFGQMMHDVSHADVAGYVHFVGPKADPLAYFAACDVFAMVSREDAFPLVCLEAASIGKPVVCFDGSGGAKEFVEDDAGYVVPYLDIESMAIRVQELLDSTEKRSRFGRRAAVKVRERYDVSIGAPKVLEIIRRFI